MKLVTPPIMDQEDNNYTLVNTTNQLSLSKSQTSWLSAGRIQIPLYAVILVLSIVGNVSVIVTLTRNRRMRTITNLFLLNLAVSDILLGVLCMPFTLIGSLLRHFVFGETMCKLLPYLQATSVAVSSWTLVAISCERYYAICHPLRSRRWQTLRHAYKLIVFIWIGSLFCMLPIAGLSRLIPTSQGHRKCREQWPSEAMYYERAFNLFLDLVLLVLPLMFLSVTYCLITKTLWHGIQNERDVKHHVTFNDIRADMSSDSVEQKDLSKQIFATYIDVNRPTYQPSRSSSFFKSVDTRGRTECCGRNQFVSTKDQHSSTLRRTNVEKNLKSKQRVIKMLFVLVLEFFLCWTPLYVINTIALFDPKIIYHHLGYTAISYFQLLAYSSSCCNPITYCFMNPTFRKAFLDTFKGFKRKKTLVNIQIGDMDTFKARRMDSKE